jgi:hypothetical protein
MTAAKKPGRKPAKPARKPAKRKSSARRPDAPSAPDGPPKAAQRLTPFSDEELIEAARRERGLVSRIADRVGCSVPTVYARMEKCPELKQTVREARERVCDKAEANLFDHVDRGSVEVSKWFLTTVGRERGYVTRTESRVGGDASAPPIGLAFLREVEELEKLDLSADTLVEIAHKLRERGEADGAQTGEARVSAEPESGRVEALPGGSGAAGGGLPNPGPPEQGAGAVDALGAVPDGSGRP